MNKESCPICNKEFVDVKKHMKRVHKQEQISIPIMREGHLEKIYATRVLSMMTEFDFRLVLVNEKTMINNTEVYIPESMAILTPLAAKELSTQLNVLVKKWETTNGSIQQRPQKSIFTNMSL